jgi:carboxylesterase type B
MDEKVVVVTPNYRLGPFGFLNTGTESARGNMGLKDLVLALKWVKKTIHLFGGDSKRIIVEGSSTGGFAASYLTISPMAEGIYQVQVVRTLLKQNYNISY